MEYKEREQVALCQTIEAELRGAQVAYGDPDEDPRLALLWRISPRYFFLSKKRWEGKRFQQPGLRSAAEAFVDFYLTVHREGRLPVEPFYFRLDGSVTDRNATAITEWNLVPVGEGGVAVNRGLYGGLVPMPEGYHNPFPGNITVLAEALAWYGGRAAILVPKSRRNYTRDYLKTAAMLRELGIEIWVEEPLNLSRRRGALCGKHGRIDTLFRVFPESALFSDWELACGKEIVQTLRQGEVQLFPPFSPLESKESMAWLFADPDWRSTEAAKKLRELIPWTWPTDPDCPPQIGKRQQEWFKHLMGEEGRKAGYVLKPCEEFGGKGLVFSVEVAEAAWRKALGNALLDWARGKRRSVIQKMLTLKGFPVSYLEDGRIVNEPLSWRVRFCLTGVWLPEGGLRIGDLDATLRTGTLLIHQQPDCVFVPTVFEGRG